MSTRNSRAAKAARRSERQDRRRDEAAAGISRARIAEAVHQAVCEVDDSDGFGRCAYYARPGALVASIVTGNEYVVQAGEMRVDVDALGEQALGMIPAASGHTGIEFHAWFGRLPAGAKPGTVRRGDDLELVDLGMRHYRRAAEALGMTWEREPLPSYFWGTAAQLRTLRVTLKPDPVTMQQIIQYQEMDTVLDIAARALRKLGLARTADQLLSAPSLTG